MKVKRKDAAETCRRLLKYACEIFAAKGYRDATIAEISEKARANIAAVNYHFGDKETLYKEAWRHSFRESIEKHPPDGGVDDSTLPKERLRAHVTALLRRISDKDCKEFSIAFKEMANPTGLLREVMKEEIEPFQGNTMKLVRELLGPQASDEQVNHCCLSIMQQCINPMVVESVNPQMERADADFIKIKDVESYAEHVYKFTLAGIQAVRREVEKSQNNTKASRGSKK